MDPQSVRRRVRNQTVSYSTSHQLKYERERLELQRCVTEQLVSDVLSLFEKSLFVDVKLETSRGSILSHQLIFVARVPSFWKLLLEIAKFQHTDKDRHEDLFAIQLPDINYQELQVFIRSLYTNETNKIAGVNLRKQLEDKLAVLQQRALLCSRHIHIQKLSSDEESVLQQLLLQQLQSGQLSEQKGNVRDVQRLFRSDAPRCRHHVVQNVPSDTDTNSTTTLTSEATKYSPSVVESVRPKSSHRNQAATPKALGNTMNITNHCVLANDKSDTKERQHNAQTSYENYDNKSGNDVTTPAKFERGSISLKGTVPTKRATDEPSPTGRLSNQESPVFNVSMIKELQTSPMQVSGETFQVKDKSKDTSPQATRSSNTVFTAVEFFQEAGSDCYNGHLTPIKTKSQGNVSPRTDLNPKGKPHRYGAMSSTRENASLHQASTGTKYPDHHRAATSKSNFHLKGPSFSGESQDSCDLDIPISNSGSEHRLSHLHETSSLEVELPSSHEENSTSHDSEGSSISMGHQEVCQTHDSEYTKENELNDEEDAEYPKRPLVRARTFEVFEPSLSNQNPAESPEKDTNKSDTKMMDLVSSGISSNPHVSFATAKGSPASRSEERYTTGNGKERKISDEVVGAYSDSVEDPEKLREIERKKGSLLFEHNFQTYSNIPTTNMMTASMMTASISSESSMGVPSLYSSMMDSALLSSIHSLGGLDAAMVDPIPRPASVGLPVMHQMEEPSPDMVCVPTPHPQGYTGHIDMAQNMELDMEREQGSRSPSPDSLSVDFAAKRELEVNYRSKHGRKSLRDECMSPVKKEEMDTEEKERDDRENESCSDNSNIESKEEARDKRTEETPLNVFASLTGSPRLSRMENTPIISGGSTLKREKKDSTDMKPIPKCERQVSIGSVKDVDAIPLVFGFIGPQDDEEEEEVKAKEEAKKEAKSGEDEDKPPQSIFSMFIDLNEIPSPSKENPKEAEHKEASKNKAASSAVYMYIEADTPSPKTRRKRKSESDGLVMSKSVDIPPDSEFTSLPPVLCGPKEAKASTTKQDEANESSDGGGKEKEKKGFFVFIETDSSSKGSPKPRRRPTPPAKKKETTNPMTRSAPSDSLVFTSQDSPSKLMTKSVIDRDEFISQPPSRKNVSVNDKINESSAVKEFVSGIPRPIRALKSIQSAITKTSKAKPSPHKRNGSTQRDASKDEPTETNDMATSRDISVSSELGPSLSVSLSSQPPDTEGASEVSNISSLLSSIDRSNDPPSDQVADPHARLGDDLLRMLLNEINTDVTIQIGEKRIRAHKCILASRCVYFAAMLSGHWVESAGNVIKLQGFSPECVMVALKHIYSGTSTVPEGVRVGELAALADMLALDGLKDVISLHLKAKMCHYFHKPCSGCLEGVLDVLPITGAYCLDELYHRCLRWVAKHFVVVLPTRNFAALPPEVQDRCLKQLLDDMSVGNVIDTALGCERVLSSLPMVRWAQPVFDSAAQLLESATSFISANLSGVLASDRFLALGKDSGWSIDSLEETMRVACELVRPDQAVLAHLHLAKLLEQNEEDGLGEVSESFLNFLENLLNQVEKFMVHNANRVAVCRKWPLLSTSTQRRIKDAAMVVVEFTRPTVPRPKLSSSNRRTRGSSSDGGGGGGGGGGIGGGIAARGGEHRLMRSASATAVPSSHRTTPRRPPSAGGGQDPSRCQTPPARLSRLRTQTPPPTRASTLRAQARQAQIQRSQSARTVAETRPCRPRQGANNSTDEDSHSSGRRTSSAAGTFTRGATFTRSLSRPEPSRPQSQTSTRLPSSSRPRTPGPSEPSHLPRRTSVTQRAASNTIPRTRSTEARTPSKFMETRSSTSSLSKAGGIENQSRISGTTEVQSSPSTLSTSRSPRTPRMGDQRTKCDTKIGNIPRGSNVVRRSARSPMREVGQSSGRNCSPSPLTDDMRSRSGSINSKTITNTATTTATTTPPSLGSRSNTFCKDDKDCANKNTVGP